MGELAQKIQQQEHKRQSGAGSHGSADKKTMSTNAMDRKMTHKLSCPCDGGCPRCIQAKLAISQPGDSYELEADRVSDQVMRMPAPEVSRRETLTTHFSGSVMRQCADDQSCPDEEPVARPLNKPEEKKEDPGEKRARSTVELVDEMGKAKTRYRHYTKDTYPTRWTDNNFADCTKFAQMALEKTGEGDLFGRGNDSTPLMQDKIRDVYKGTFRKTNPKVGDIVMWGGHVGIVTEVVIQNKSTYIAYANMEPRGNQPGANIEGKYKKKNGEYGYWLRVEDMPGLKNLGDGDFMGFWTPPDNTAPAKGETPAIQRRETADHDRRSSLYDPDASLSVDEVLHSHGQPLSEESRAFFEPRFGYDFGEVRVHTDNKAARSAGSINALAYTAGKDIVFGKGQYAPSNQEGKKLLGHELAHVVQQSGKRQANIMRQVAKGSDAGTPEKEVNEHDDIKIEFTATVLSEAYEGQEQEIAWTYYDLVTKLGNVGLDKSSAHKYKGAWYKVWMVGLGDTKYKDHKVVLDPKTNEEIKVSDYVKNNGWFKEVGMKRANNTLTLVENTFKKLTKDPHEGWMNHGSLQDFNRDDSPWVQARQYYYLQNEKKVSKEYIVILPGKMISIRFDGDSIVNFFKAHPDMLKIPVKKYKP